MYQVQITTDKTVSLLKFMLSGNHVIYSYYKYSMWDAIIWHRHRYSYIGVFLLNFVYLSCNSNIRRNVYRLLFFVMACMTTCWYLYPWAKVLGIILNKKKKRKSSLTGNLIIVKTDQRNCLAWVQSAIYPESSFAKQKSILAFRFVPWWLWQTVCLMYYSAFPWHEWAQMNNSGLWDVIPNLDYQA